MLDIGISSPPGSPDPLIRDQVASLDHARYSFLMDYFATFTRATGVEIVPYDDARVDGAQLDMLEEQMILARAAILAKPSRWDEHVGFQSQPRKKLFEPIRKGDFLAELDKLLELIRKARSGDTTLFFFGD